MEELENFYKLNKKIEKQRERHYQLILKQQQRGKAIDKQISLKLEKVTETLIDLMNTRNDDIKIVYSHEKILARLVYCPKNVVPDDTQLIQSPITTPLLPISQDTRNSRARSAAKIEFSTKTPSPIPVPTFNSDSTKSVISSLIDTNSKKIVVLPPAPSHSPLKITRMVIGDNLTQFKMAPDYFIPDDQELVLKNIVYPDDVVDRQLYNTVARYRINIGKSIDFNNEPLQLGVDSVETLILTLELFSQQFDGELNFSKTDLPFEYSSQRAACGMADFGSILVLLADVIPTAKFEFQIGHFDYDELAQSRDMMEKFALDFCAAMSETLKCEPDYIRLFSIEKSSDELNMLKISFGLTTPILDETEKLAKDLQIQARCGFMDQNVLKYVKQTEYECKWKTVIEYFNIQTSDLDPRYNFDYRRKYLSEKDKRGNEPYYLPIGWYRYALKVDNKYAGDNVWLGQVNAEGEWPVAFHGTKEGAVLGIAQQGLLASKFTRDLMRDEAVKLIGTEADHQGIYLATHCNQGADAYADEFSLPNSTGKSGKFQVVFQCRVQPGKFTRHTRPVITGEAWRFVDERAIRPYGILLKEVILPKTDDSIANLINP